MTSEGAYYTVLPEGERRPKSLEERWTLGPKVILWARKSPLKEKIFRANANISRLTYYLYLDSFSLFSLFFLLKIIAPNMTISHLKAMSNDHCRAWYRFWVIGCFKRRSETHYSIIGQERLTIVWIRIGRLHWTKCPALPRNSSSHLYIIRYQVR